ncbi:hypothetical protein GOP47_0009447 [Adiantum capillus-veneris]|uniref:Uncharacterized protein n=1 Tax=Adiantum capillus-veneris TaxID=13818 RepID=A0A9D4ZJI6_ADICA|nr:hypothetical protein GOP47_0009447 [Adiantum capillus-veneris]
MKKNLIKNDFACQKKKKRGCTSKEKLSTDFQENPIAPFFSPLFVMLNFHGQILVNKTHRLSSFTVDWNAPTHVESKRTITPHP